MAEDLYTIRRKYREGARKKEREYSKAAVSNATGIARNIAEDAAAAGAKITKGGSEIGAAAFDATQGNYGAAAENLGYGMLNTAAGVANAAFSPASGAIRTLLPNLGVTEAAMDYAANTDAGKQAMQLAQQYPRQAEAAMNALDLAGLKGSTRLFGNAFNAVAENAPTKMPGFYDSPNPLSKGWAAAKATAPNLGRAITQMYYPQALAERRVIGTGSGRRKEYVTAAEAGDQSITKGNALGSSFINAQVDRRTSAPKDTVVGNTAEAQRMIQDWTDISNVENVKTNLSSLTEAPDNVLDGAYEHLSAVHGTKNTPGETSLVVRKPLSGEGLDAEATGGAYSASSVAALASQGTLDLAKQALPDVDPLDFYTQYVTASKHANSNNIRLAVKEDKLPSHLITKTGVARAKLLASYWTAVKRKNKGQKISEGQQQVLDFFDKAPKAKLRDRGDGVYSFSDTHVSRSQDLGGVNDWVAIDTKNNKVYTMISDGHDMFGMNPVGGNSLINTTPIYSFEIGQKSKFESGQKVDVSTSKIEELTGMPREKGESATAYQARVMRDYRGKANLGDYLNVGKNVADTGMLLSQVQDPEEQ